ncbi:MAG: acetyl-CoA carboxylase, carboxyltransferase subunit beta [Pseudomonadota bacterium]
MNWLSNLTPPGIKNIFKRPEDNADTLWVKCKGCGEMIFQRDLEAALYVCPSCGHHMAIGSEDRLAMMFDEGAYTRVSVPDTPTDPLKFRDTKKYADRLRDHRRRTGEKDAIIVAEGTIEAMPTVISIQNFSFMGGSMGMAVGEGFVTAASKAIELKAPLVMFSASGGARMQESILSLMQMPRTTIAVEMLREAGLPFIVILTNPTTGGVTASFAMLGDIHIAEPGALIGFAGRRVIEQTIREQLPEEFQRSEFLLEKGMVDIVAHRKDLRETIAKLVRVLLIQPRVQGQTDIPTTAEATIGADDEEAGVRTAADDDDDVAIPVEIDDGTICAQGSAANDPSAMAKGAVDTGSAGPGASPAVTDKAAE